MREPDYPNADVPKWVAVDTYFSNLLAPSAAVMDAVLAANAAAGLPGYDVSAVQGKFLALLLRLSGARRVLEIGTLGGYSTLWMARALPQDGHITTIECSLDHAAVAKANFRAAGLDDRIELCVGEALTVLPALRGPYDLIFIDADKPNNPAYLQWALALARPGTVIVADNVVRGGAVTDAHSTDANVRGVRRYLEDAAAEPRLDSTALQTVGEKGWDGFALSLVRA